MKTCKSFVMFLLMLSLSAATLAAHPVRLVVAQPFSYAVSGMSWSETTIAVHVDNIGSDFSRNVFVNYTLSSSGNWQRSSLDLEANHGTHSLYKIVLPASTVEFAVELQSDVGSYWDNNGGANYKVQAWSVSAPFVNGTVGQNVALKEATSNEWVVSTKYGVPYIVESMLTASIYVENLSYNKDVGMVVNYGDGNWQWVDGTYAYSMSTGGANNIEVWDVEFNYYGHPYPTDWEFAVYYHNLDSGSWYWDNNFEKNYSLGKITGDTVN